MINKLYFKMIEYYQGDPKRIQHFTKVHSYSKLIAEGEGLDKRMIGLIEAAALVHDIGIKVAEAKYNSCAGHLQEQEGPSVACEMLTELGFDSDFIERISYLVGHHHHYNNIDGIDYQILVEADFLVNFYEDNMSKEAICAAYDKIFRTTTGCMIAESMYGLK